MHALEELKNLKEKNVQLEELLEESKREKHEVHGEFERTIVGLKFKVEEATVIEEVLTSHLKKKDEIYQTRELEITCLRKELEDSIVHLKISDLIQQEEVRKNEERLTRHLKEKKEIFQEQELEIASLKGKLEKAVNTNMKFEKSCTLDSILKPKKSPSDKTGIGYKNEHTIEVKEFTSLEKKIDGRPQSVALNLSKINEENNKKKDYVKKEMESEDSKGLLHTKD